MFKRMDGHQGGVTSTTSWTPSSNMREPPKVAWRPAKSSLWCTGTHESISVQRKSHATSSGCRDSPPPREWGLAAWWFHVPSDENKILVPGI